MAAHSPTNRMADHLLEVTAKPYVLPGVRHNLTLAERLIIETPSVRRMSRLRQTGLAFHTSPMAENSRLPHCIGTSYWANVLLSAMRSNRYAERLPDWDAAAGGNRQRLDDIQESLGPNISLELLVRIFALIHDSDLLPFGHTLSYQLGYYPPPGTPARFVGYIDQIIDELRRRPDCKARQEEIESVEEYLREIQTFSHPPRSSCHAETAHLRRSRAHRFVESLVTATVSADLIDFVYRDSLAAGRPVLLDVDALAANAAVLSAQDTPDGALSAPRAGFVAWEDGGAATGVTQTLNSLIEARYRVISEIVYERGKFVFDAMLDKGIRNTNAHHAGEPFDESEILALGDDEFLSLLASAEECANLGPLGASVTPEILSSRPFDVTFEINDPDQLSPDGSALARGCADAFGRDELERLLLKDSDEIADTDVAVGFIPEGGQGKVPHVYVAWEAGDVLSYRTLINRGLVPTPQFGAGKEYGRLWRLAVLTRPGMAPENCRLIAGRAAQLLTGRNN